MLGWSEIEIRAVAFQKTWKKSLGDERQEGQTFEKDFMNVFGVDFREGLHEHQIILNDGTIGYMDYFLPGKILIEMKSKGKSLATAYTQAMRYIHALKPEEIPKLVMVCDFNRIEVYNLNKDHKYKPFKVSQLKTHVRLFGILSGYDTESEVKTEIELNTDASYKMAKLHDALKVNGYVGHALEVYLVRLLFCLFADDTGIFEKVSFEKYISSSKEDGSDLSMRIMMLFSILDTPPENRMKNLSNEINRFRYINGNLFSETLPPASFDSKMRKTLLECCDFEWSQISPAIFGAMFQGVMDQQERRELGAHYTSEENIMKVLNPLFLDDLYDEFEHSKNTVKELNDFHDKIAKLKFLDPACGSGNFLILAYQKLRELEFEILKYLYYDGSNQQMAMLGAIYTKVHINQFYGIEYEEFPSEIAKVSLLLTKHLMDQEVSNHFGVNLIDFPIKENANIVHGNALTIDWGKVVSQLDLSYIIGNPPFVGARLMSVEQKEDITHVFKNIKGIGNLDYVSAWYYKAAEFIQSTSIQVAFVSTNSITQGEQVAILWKPIINLKIKIDFAYRTFKWSNDAKGKAAVHCVIVSFSNKIFGFKGDKRIFNKDGTIEIANNINGYLINAPDIFIESRTSPLFDVPSMNIGNKPIDDGNYLFTYEEMISFIQDEPESKEYFYKWYGAREFINNTPRYCLLVQNIPIKKLTKMKKVMERIENVRNFRLRSNSPGTVKLADTPMLFHVTNIPSTNYLLIPSTSSERRRYIPIGYMNKDCIASNANLIIVNSSIYIFSVLSSNIHMAWIRTVGGRLKSDYRYSASIVYNNFPWPDLNEDDKFKLEKTGNMILDARAKYPDSYADLYNPLIMPPELQKAHLINDRTVWEVYGKAWKISSEEDCIAYLMKRYQELISE